MSKDVTIAVDAMGGDGSPKKVIDGISNHYKNSKNTFYRIFGDEDQIKNNLVNQVTEMVRWRETMIKFIDLGVREFYEIGSGSVLSNLAKRSCPSFKRKSAGNKESLESLLLELDS